MTPSWQSHYDNRPCLDIRHFYSLASRDVAVTFKIQIDAVENFDFFLCVW